MQKLFLTLGLTLLVAGTHAQVSEPLLFKIEYRFIHILDKKNNDTLHQEDMVLRAGKSSSIYSTMPFNIVLRKREDIPPPPPPASAGTMITVQGSAMAIAYDWGITEETLYLQYSENEIIKINPVGTIQYAVKSTIPVIDWQVREETKTIGGYTCQKAEGTYAGRRYTVWFTPDLPISAGPWKLTGLPGVILEAGDDREEVFFLFKQISEAEEKEVTEDDSNRKLVFTTDAAFKKAKDGYDQNPAVVVQAQTGASRAAPLRFKSRTGKFFSGEDAYRMLEEKRKRTKDVSKNPLELK